MRLLNHVKRGCVCIPFFALILDFCSSQFETATKYILKSERLDSKTYPGDNNSLKPQNSQNFNHFQLGFRSRKNLIQYSMYETKSKHK
jgi:hypothetical protein